MIVIKGSQVNEIRQDGITYLDDAGQEQFIDFEACYQDYLAGRLSPKAIQDFQQMNRIADEDMPAHIERIKKWREVGKRNVLGDDIERRLPYIVFYTSPRIRIEFDHREKYDEVIYLLRKSNWHTFDMT
jgi:hypothetical protein